VREVRSMNTRQLQEHTPDNSRSDIPRRRRSWIIQATGSVVLLVVGAVVGALIDNYIKGDLANDTDLIVAIFFLGLVVIVAYVSSHLTHEENEEREVLDVLSRLESRLGLRVQYQETSLLNKQKQGEVAIDRVRELISKANEEVLILDFNDRSMPRYDYALEQELRIEHYKSLMARVEYHALRGTPFVYKRICQLNPNNMTLKDINDPIFLDHCQKMLVARQQNEHRVYLQKTGVVYPFTFVVIDKIYLIIHLIGVKPVESHLESYLKGEIIIYDPQRELVEVFLNAWENVEHDVRTKTIDDHEFD